MKIHSRFLRSSGRALNGLVGHLCSSGTRHDDCDTSKCHTTANTPCKDGSSAASKATDDDGNTQEQNVQLKEKSVTPLDPPRKLTAKDRLKSWINSGNTGIIGRYGSKLELEVGFFNAPKRLSAEPVDTGWPDWLVNVAPEAVLGWLPRRADSFEKLDKVGQGTYSSVYKARDLKTGKVVALKKVRFVNADPESVRFMAREICILRKLNHPNVIKLEGIITSSVSQTLYLVFEYMEHDLVGLAATPGLKFTEAQVKCLMQQILSGLDHCHSHGVLHRDMKGSNLLIDSDGVLKIADFGLATFYDPDSRQPLTNRVATLWYRPPELLLGATVYTAAVDMWSTGCILAELLVGKPIMPGRTEVEQIHKIFKLCGSPSDEYWKKLRVSPTGNFKPHRHYKRCIAENFKHLPHSTLALLDSLLALEPEARGTAASTLQSDFFRTEPFACGHSSLPKCPPSKEYDVRLRQEEARRQRKAESVRPRNECQKKDHAANCSTKLKNYPHINSEINRANLNHPEVPGHQYNSVRVATTVVGTCTDIKNDTPTSRRKNMAAKYPTMKYRGSSRRLQYSRSLITPEGNVEDMLREHERNIQEAVRKARLKPLKKASSCSEDE